MAYDVIVLGVGGMGSAACYHLAKRGARVLGLERFPIGHDRGSSHGTTRLIRQAYFENEKYVPLLKSSYALWNELEDRTGKTLFHKVGLLMMGPSSGGMALPGARATAAKHQITIELYDEKELKKRYPQFRAPEGYHGMMEPDAGYLEVENCVISYVEAARALGAEIRTEAVTDLKKLSAGKIVVTAGPWAPGFLPALPLEVRRVPQFWFPATELYDTAPCFAFDRPEGFVYGFPSGPTPGLVKAADYKSRGATVSDPLTVDRVIHDDDIGIVGPTVRACLPGVSPQYAKASVCLYTMTPDENFIVDTTPEGVVYAAGFSGHGFKFASVMGEVLAELALDGKTKHDIGFLSASRFIG